MNSIFWLYGFFSWFQINLRLWCSWRSMENRYYINCNVVGKRNVQGNSERTDVFWMASTGGGVVRLWSGMARLKEETREFQYCSVSIIDSRCLPGVVLEKVRSNNCRWANCTPNCDFRGVQRVLMQNFRVRWGPFPSQRLLQQTKLSLLVPNEPWNSASRPSALP